MRKSRNSCCNVWIAIMGIMPFHKHLALIMDLVGPVSPPFSNSKIQLAARNSYARAEQIWAYLKGS